MPAIITAGSTTTCRRVRECSTGRRLAAICSVPGSRGGSCWSCTARRDPSRTTSAGRSAGCACCCPRPTNRIRRCECPTRRRRQAADRQLSHSGFTRRARIGASHTRAASPASRPYRSLILTVRRTVSLSRPGNSRSTRGFSRPPQGASVRNARKGPPRQARALPRASSAARTAS